MTDRHAAYIVVLDNDIRKDDAEEIVTALRMVRFVASVEPVIADYSTVIARARRDREWASELHDLITRMDRPGGSSTTSARTS